MKQRHLHTWTNWEKTQEMAEYAAQGDRDMPIHKYYIQSRSCVECKFTEFDKQRIW